MTKRNISPITSLLVANRGEISYRILKTAKAIGLRTIAVYSDADREAPHVSMADDAFYLGPAPVGESYLSLARIMTALKETGADAVHPGYGFLSENADFAKACENEDIIFVGPNSYAIDIMGDKARAKRHMISAGVPCIPGYQGQDQSDKTFLKEAEKIGFPVMVKAAAGGGGRGIRLVEDNFSLLATLALARSEAENTFGNGDLILEKAIINPRHVEIQIMADQHKNIIHLGERDCSVQRRHQKVLEESPCPIMTECLRKAMGKAAVKAAASVDYVGAGTVEFLLDDHGNFYFLEMNTRLQVEHPVTEMVTGLDLVAMQLRIAQGYTLDVQQNNVDLKGHAIEARLYAEDTTQDFLPTTGRIEYWNPAFIEGVRYDTGIETGTEISPYYDPMIAKVISHGATRQEARQKLMTALKDTGLSGIPTNRRFLIDALSEESFTKGEATTSFIEDNFPKSRLSIYTPTREELALGALILFEKSKQLSMQYAPDLMSNLQNWSSATAISTEYRFNSSTADIVINVIITPISAQYYKIDIDGDYLSVIITKSDSHTFCAQIDKKTFSLKFTIPNNSVQNSIVYLSHDGHDFTLQNLNAIIDKTDQLNGDGIIRAPMHGLLVAVDVDVGAQVKKGQRLLVLEAMKMQHELLADIDGTVEEIHVNPNQQVTADTLLLTLKQPNITPLS